MAKEKSKNKSIFLAITILLVSVAVLIFSFLVSSGAVLEVNEIPASLFIGATAGFDINNSAFTFGRIPPGASSTRSLRIVNEYDFPISVEFKSEGNITEFLRFEKNLQIEPGQTKITGITAKAGSDEEFASYSGNVLIIIKKASYLN